MKNIKEKVLKEVELWKGWNRTTLAIDIIDKTLAEVGKVIDDEKKIVEILCIGLIHPSQENQKDFTKWLQDTVNFHINQIKQKLGIEVLK